MLAIESSSLLLSEHAPCFASTANPASSAQAAGEQTYFPLSLMACADVRGILGEGLVQSWQACGSEGQVSGEVAGRPQKHPTGGHSMASPLAGTMPPQSKLRGPPFVGALLSSWGVMGRLEAVPCDHFAARAASEPRQRKSFGACKLEACGRCTCRAGRKLAKA